MLDAKLRLKFNTTIALESMYTNISTQSSNCNQGKIETRSKFKQTVVVQEQQLITYLMD